MATNETRPLGQYLRPLRDHVKLVVVVSAVVVVLGSLASAFVPTSYRSTASILVSPISTDPNETLRSDVTIEMTTEERIATSQAVVDLVADQLSERSIEISHDELSANLMVSSPKGSRILDVSYAASTSALAQVGADAFAQTYLDYRSQLANESKAVAAETLQERITTLKAQLAEVSAELLRNDESSEAFVTATVERESIRSELDAQQESLASLSTVSVDVGRIISAAEAPDSPEGVGTPAMIVGVIIGGLVVGCIAAFLVDAFKETSIDPTANSVLSPAVVVPSKSTAPIVVRPRAPLPPEPERAHENGSSGEVVRGSTPPAIGIGLVSEPDFTALLTRTYQPGEDQPFSCVCFGEVGRDASVAIGLGLADVLQARGAQVLIVELLLERPILHELFNIPAEPGLLDVLSGKTLMITARQLLPEMGGLRALTIGDSEVLARPARVDELLNGWGIRGLLGATAQPNHATIFLGGTVANAARFGLLLREVDGVVVGTEEPPGRPVRQELASRLSAMSSKSLGLISLNPAPISHPDNGSTDWGG
ncbi:MAG: hypothetical protein GY773_27235 [Actinomycetia bacterium]|nr:hypothetical protein [Actinomycetes bacterium]